MSNTTDPGRVRCFNANEKFKTHIHTPAHPHTRSRTHTHKNATINHIAASGEEMRFPFRFEGGQALSKNCPEALSRDVSLMRVGGHGWRMCVCVSVRPGNAFAAQTLVWVCVCVCGRCVRFDVVDHSTYTLVHYSTLYKYPPQLRIK